MSTEKANLQQVGEVQGDARAQFEAWASAEGYDTQIRAGDYWAADTRRAWLVWKAALAAPPAQGIDLGQFRQAVVHWYADADNANTNPGWVRDEADRLLALIDQRDEVE